jgi:hypothetical protein
VPAEPFLPPSPTFLREPKERFRPVSKGGHPTAGTSTTRQRGYSLESLRELATQDYADQVRPPTRVLAAPAGGRWYERLRR